VEAELTAQTKALERVKAALTTHAKAFGRAKAELIDDVANAYAAGFEDCLALVACKHPKMVEPHCGWADRAQAPS